MKEMLTGRIYNGEGGGRNIVRNYDHLKKNEMHIIR